MRSSLFSIILLAAASVFSQTPAAVETELVSDLENISKFGTYSGAYDEALSDKANRHLRETLVRNGKRLEILKYSFPKLKGEMNIATSKDGKLRIYSWDLQTGGTMHDYENVYQYQGKSGSVHTWSAKRDNESSGSFCTQIFQVRSKNGPVYLANSTSISEGSLQGQSISVLRISADKLDNSAKLIRTNGGLRNSISFGYDPSSTADLPDGSEKLVTFDETKQAFRFPVVVEDEEFRNGRVTNKFITYRFNGNYFVKVR